MMMATGNTDEIEDRYINRLCQSSMNELIEETCVDKYFKLKAVFFCLFMIQQNPFFLSEHRNISSPH